ncbi:MAG: MucR family transcriptional regulator [Maricaulis sp.]|jgi:predicted transcriptional regulator|uniref:MucR family transcriptional regulator n=1 Tax=Maricaulis sp. TaxID=1486257 RepID=UPI001B1B5BCE|nr:MucR family transcriptional regulator [Maricaulis sp.]MBO6846423.1 MucR family transcriptional regulator [Maricaulis sp.]MBO6876654.1 MucR family transcriptional regulator [Maricaulis sp.]MDM7982997.1 MucR family transcriptional regulator [Maricaulis sp.]
MTDSTLPDIDREELLRMTTDIVSSYLSHNSVPAENVPDLIKSVHSTMTGVSLSEEKAEQKAKPAVPVSKSIADDHIVCLEDGKKLKMLKRYLRSQYNMSPDEYRQKWNLPSDYPMVAPAYSRKRSQFAKDIGLGRGAKA